MVDSQQIKEFAFNQEAADYIDDLWFLLHHSEDEETAVLGMTCYIDDSGSDDGSPLVTCGGVMMTRIQFKQFSLRWAKMYERNQFTGYYLEPPLHMSDFVGMGKYASLYPELKAALFRDVANLVNEHKLYSISIAISQEDFQSELAVDIRKALIGAYGFAFFCLVATNQGVSEALKLGPFKTSYLVDRGFGQQWQLNEAHDLIVRFETAMGGFRHTGALATDADDHIPALQAADAIAWASRKMELNGQLPNGFEPLGELLHSNCPHPHTTIPIPRDGIQMFADPVNKWISKYGAVPRLTDIVSRNLGGVPVKLKS